MNWKHKTNHLDKAQQTYSNYYGLCFSFVYPNEESIQTGGNNGFYISGYNNIWEKLIGSWGANAHVTITSGNNIYKAFMPYPW